MRFAQRGESWYCSNGQGVSSKSDANFPNPDTQTQSGSTTNGQVLDTLALVENVDLSTMPCPDGFGFTGGTYSLAVTASNFAGQQAQAFFAFQVMP